MESQLNTNQFRDDEIVIMSHWDKNKEEWVRTVYPKIGGRLRRAHEDNDNLSITTEIIRYDENIVVVRAVSTTKKGAFTGISIANSEVGILAFSIEAYFYRLICSNGLISTVSVASRFKHISRRALDEFPDILKRVVYESEHNQRRFEISTQSRVDNPLQTIGSFNRQFNTTKKEAEAIEHAWEIEQGFTMFHVINAYTRAAQDRNLSTEASYKLEKVGGLILSLVKS